jgi:hypothetical protein
MSFCKRIALPAVAVSFLAFLVACGSTTNKSVPPPTGAFSNSNLSGTYVFSTLGTDSGGAPITIVGAFTACGCSGGTISSGTFSYFDPTTVGLLSAQAISGGSYNVTSDGRGQANLSTSAVGAIRIDFVLNSTSGGLVTEYDTNGTGSGTIDLQPSAVSQSDLAGNYAFSVSGANATSGAPFASAGAFTLSATGSLTAGVYDVTTLGSLPIVDVALQNTSSVTVGTGTAPGTAVITDASSNSYKFDVYAVSAGHLKVIETDGGNLSSGDIFTQGTSLPSGTLVFTMGGVDTSGDPLAMGGLLPVSGGSISGGTEDYNDFGTVNSTTSVSGLFGALSGGRATLQLGSFFNGSTGNGTYTFAAYPSSNGTIVLEIDNGGITSGSLMVQTSTSFAASQGYGADLSATNISQSVGGTCAQTQSCFEEDDIAEFTSSASSFTGLIDVNDEGTTSFDKVFNGSYAPVSTGRYSFTANSSSDFNGFTGVFYTVDGSNILFLEGDNFQVGTGVFQIQNASGAKSAMARFGMAIPKLAKNAARRRIK